MLLYPERLDEFDSFDQEKFSFFKIKPPSPSSYRFRTIKCWAKHRNDIQKACKASGMKPDLVYFLWADDLRFPNDHFFINALSKLYIENFINYSWSGLYFHPNHYRKEIPEKIELDRVFSFQNCAGINVLDEGIAEKLEAQIRNDVVVIPDITFEEEEDLDHNLLNKILSLAEGRKIVSCVGAIERRKGVLELIKIFGQQKDVLFIIAGKLRENSFSEAELREYISLKQNCKNGLFIEKFLSNEEINSIYDSSSIVWAAYVDFPHSSGVLTKAAISHKPVIVNSGFLMEERVREFNTGLVVDLTDLEAAKNNIFQQFEYNWDITTFEAYKKAYSIREFTEKFKNFITSKIN